MSIDGLDFRSCNRTDSVTKEHNIDASLDLSILVLSVLDLPTPKRAREERPCFRLVTCLCNKFIFMGGVPTSQSFVAAAVCYLLNRFSGQAWKALFRFAAKICHIKYIAFKLWNYTGSGNCEKIRMSNYSA